jgi:hypothetical protein
LWKKGINLHLNLEFGYKLIMLDFFFKKFQIIYDSL